MIEIAPIHGINLMIVCRSIVAIVSYPTPLKIRGGFLLLKFGQREGHEKIAQI